MTIQKNAFFFLSEAPGDDEETDVALPNTDDAAAKDDTTDTAAPEEDKDATAEEPVEEPVEEDPIDDTTDEEAPEPDTAEDEAAVDNDIDADSAENMKIHALYERFEENERVLISIREVLQDLQARKLDDVITSTILTVEREVNELIDKVKIVLEGDFTSDNYSKMLTVFTYIQTSIILIDKIMASFLDDNDDKTKGKK